MISVTESLLQENMVNSECLQSRNSAHVNKIGCDSTIWRLIKNKLHISLGVYIGVTVIEVSVVTINRDDGLILLFRSYASFLHVAFFARAMKR